MERDEIWGCFVIPVTFEGFCKETIPEINLKPEVNEDVHKSFRVVRKLLEHSYYEYEFFDMAALKSILSFEMALKLRYQELTGTKWSENKSLKTLIQWFHEKRYFEVYNDSFLDYVRMIRNHSAHPYRHGLSGAMGRQNILYSIDLINDLYEDPELRVKRMTLMNEISSKVKELNTNGLKITFADDSSVLVCAARPVFINNKMSPAEISFSYKPLFPLPESFVPGIIHEAPTYKIVADSIEILDSSIILHDIEHNNMVISKIESKEDKLEFELWIAKFIECNAKIFQFGIMNMQDTQYFSEHLREFHFTK